MPESSITTICPKCGGALSPDAPRGLCVKCLLASMLDGGRIGAPKPSTVVGKVALPRAFGAYELLEELARGGMGIVYRARQSQLNREVAVKVMAAGPFAAPDFVARFRTEAEAVASLDHPNIVPIYEVGECEGQPFFSMKLVEGGSLARRVAASRESAADPSGGNPAALCLRDAAILVAKLARAIHYAHQRGILHRDIKPGNVLLDAQGEPHLTDFSLAKLVEKDSTLTRTMAMLGTPSYMSPEQARGEAKQLTTAVDVYGLGAVFYELLTGQPPFAGGTTMETVRLVLDQAPRRPSALRPGLDRDLETICLKCLEKEPKRRYGSAEAVAEELERWLRHEPITARPVSALESAAKWVRRHPGRSAGLGVVLVLLLAIAWGSLAFSLRLKKERDRADANARVAREEQANTWQALARAQIALAEAAYRVEDGLGMKAALDAVPTDLRDSTWHYLMAHADTAQASVAGAFIGAAAHPTRAGVFALSERGGGSLVLSQAKTGERLQQFKTTPRQGRESYYRGLAISPDGQRLAVGSLGQGGIAIYALTDGSPVAEWEGPETDTLEFSADGRWLLQASSIQAQVCLWEAATGRRLWSLQGANLAVFKPVSRSVPPSPNPVGAEVIAAQGAELILLDATSGSVVRRLCRFPTGLTALAARPQGRLVVAGDYEGFVHGVNLADGRILFERHAANRYVQSLDFTADGARFVTVSEAENQNQAIRVWDAETGTRLQSLLGGSSKAGRLRIHPLTDEVLITGQLTRTWALARAAPAWTLPGGATAAFFGGDDACLAAAGRGVGWFPLTVPNPVPQATLAESSAWKIAVSADGRVAAVTSFGNLSSETRMLRCDGARLDPFQTVPDKYAVSFTRLSPAGDRLLLFVPGGKCSGQYDAATGTRLANLDDARPLLEINDAAWLSGTRVLGAVTARQWRGTPDSEEQLVLWDAPSGKLLRTERQGSLVHCLAPAPDGRRFAEAGDDKEVRLRDGTTLAIQNHFRAHDASITALAWHPQRPILATASADLTIKLWEVPAGRLLEELRGPLKPARMLSFSPGGTRILSAGADQTRVWKPAALRSEEKR